MATNHSAGRANRSSLPLTSQLPRLRPNNRIASIRLKAWVVLSVNSERTRHQIVSYPKAQNPVAAAAARIQNAPARAAISGATGATFGWGRVGSA